MQFPFFHIVRVPNLLIIGLTQALVFSTCVNKSLTVLTWIDLILLSVITMTIAASGYVINDYYDVRMDEINKPQKRIAMYISPLREIITWYFLLLAFGWILSIILAWKLELAWYLFLYPLACFSLWVYSVMLKCKPLIGNIWVALFCGGVVAIVAFPDILTGPHEAIRPELWMFMLFASLSNLFREIIKDLEDVKGDRASGCRTFVVRFGTRFGELMACLAGAILLAVMFYWHTTLTDTWAKLILMVLELGTVALMGYIWNANNKQIYYRASLFIKIIMIAGTGILLLL